MEKHGVISSSTPGECCGGSDCEVTEKTATLKQQMLPFPDLEPQTPSLNRRRTTDHGKEPTTEKQADDMQDSVLNSAIDAVVKEIHGSSN